MLSDFICNIEMYGVVKLKRKKEDYLKNFKADFIPDNCTLLSVSSALDFILKRIVGSFLRSATRLALTRGASRVQFTAPVLMQIVYSVTYLRVIPWAIILRFINLPWVMGTFVVYIALTKLQEFLHKESVKTRLGECDSTINASKLYMSEARNKLVGLLLVCLDPESSEETKQKSEKELNKELEDLLSAKKVKDVIKSRSMKAENEEWITEEMFNVREIEDYVVVDDPIYQEKENEDGFIVVGDDK